MADQIIDGKGSGNRAQVDDHGRLYTLANMISHPAHHATYHQDFFYAYFETVLPAGGGEKVCALIQGINSSIELEVHSVLITSVQNVDMEVYFDGLYASGGTAVTPRNSNRSANRTLDVLTYAGGASADLVLSTTNQVQATGFDLSSRAPFTYVIDGSVIIGNEKSLVFSGSAAVESLVRITVGLAPHAAGTKL